MREAEELVAGYCALMGAPDKKTVKAGERGGGKAILFSPHPDDECITGGLALRLQREAGLEIINVPVTLGSKAERRQARKLELVEACAVLDFTLMEPAAHCFEHVKPETRQAQPIYWAGLVSKVATLLGREKPDIIFMPHRHDGHYTHVGTHHLVLDALAQMPDDFSVRVVFTEFWYPQADANLMVETSRQDMVRLIEALMRHKGEVARNPYHRTVPAWMIDNVRRGAEIIAGFGEDAPKMSFATLYQFGTWQHGQYRPAENDIVLPADHSAASLISLGS